MEDLNKQQLILLALLVSFVTSVATGIATASLLDQAPAKVTRVTTNVVEKIVEKVVPGEGGSSVVTREETIVVREDELLTETIAQIPRGLVRVESKDGAFLSAGFLVSDGGLVIAAGDNIQRDSRYRVVFPDGEVLNGETVLRNDETRVSVLAVSIPSDGEKPKFTPLELGDANELNLGNGVLTLGGAGLDEVNIGIVSKLDYRNKVDEKGENAQEVASIRTSLKPDLLTTGLPLVNVFGEVVGVLPSGDGAGGFVSVAIAKTLLFALQ